ncbi:LCP family protein [Paraclostridium ghonii]|uniref:LCP family protein n=1 Tax=Paraclostridium ghonii TaxID=29358 RepID=UPI00202CC8EB|nr:LCP family protein [Paeniclostridium ghonii]MCM0165594.1 LCP family protein [Paeniclostridium ghonii]
MKISKKIILILFIVVILPIGALCFFIKDSNEKQKSMMEQRKSEKIENKKVINVALFGLDRRSKDEKSRADSMMIANIDLENKTINLISILRDTLVDIKGHGKEKLNHSYAYGGPELVLNTINSNFDLNLKNYISVDFFSLAKLIDLVGGVEIDLKDYEANQINKNLDEINNIEKLPNKTDYIEGMGSKILNGRQAVAYCRIRKEGDGDYERTQRQRNVLKAIINKYENLDSNKKFEVNMEMISQVSTNVPVNDIKYLQNKILNEKNYNINQYMIPFEGSFETKTINGMWVIDANMEENIKQLHKYIK